MGLKLKTNLLIEILSPTGAIKSYSKCLLNLNTIIRLEKEEKFKIPQTILDLFENIKIKEDNFINGIPLNILEREFYKKIDNMKGYISINHLEHELNKPVSEIFILLEKFYNEMFLIASLLANYYNLEIKINQKNNDSEFI